MNPKVSIIVPVYNAERSIRRCIDSIVNQEFKEFEAILVDDGSTDSSGAICDEYASKDDRICVIHKENTGVSDSRNMAIDRARGQYLQFMDADDWIATYATNQLYRVAETNHCDLVIADFYRVVGQRVSQKGDIDADEVMTREEFAAHMMGNPADFYYGVLWNKFYRRDIIEKYQLRMNQDISWCEDFMFNLEYIRHADSFYALGVPIYYYVKTKGSLVSQGMSISRTIQMKRMVFSYYLKFYKSVFTEEDYEKNRLQVYRFLVDAAGDGTVSPMLPGSKKLGDERISTCAVPIDGDGILVEEYCGRKLLDHYLELVAIKNDLSLPEVKLLLYLDQLQVMKNKKELIDYTNAKREPLNVTQKELVDFTNMNRRTLSVNMQKLVAKGLIKSDEKRSTASAPQVESDLSELSSKRTKTERKLEITFPPKGEALLQELSAVLIDYDRVRYDGFTEDEIEQYETLTKKVKQNIQKIIM